MNSIDDLVATAFTNAAENGYDFCIDEWSDWDVALDMTSYDADLEDFEVEDVEKAVGRYRSKLLKRVV